VYCIPPEKVHRPGPRAPCVDRDRERPRTDRLVLSSCIVHRAELCIVLCSVLLVWGLRGYLNDPENLAATK